MKEGSPRELRKIIINSPQVKTYVDNTIRTAKYNIFSFLPLAVIYQFNNYFNIFFLFTAIILAIKEISPMEPGIAIAPFIFVIMKKANYDKTYNNSVTRHINWKTNAEEEVEWRNVCVGSVIKITKNEVIPADILVIQSSLKSGFCYMETTNLDGESALKPREAVALFKDAGHSAKGCIECDQPNFNIYSINGTLELSSGQKAFFAISNTLLRGTTLKNVDYVLGVVLYTGVDTKIMKNIQSFSLKNSSIEKTLNKVIIVVIITVFSICVGCTMFGMIFMSANVPIEGQTRSAYIYYAKNQSFNYTLEFFSLFGAFFIIFNNIIPISLTITFEIAKFIQVGIMSKDKEMFNGDEKFKVLSMKLQEDLGNVKYIFSDKTGTLTKNEMIFRACSIYSKMFFDEEGDSMEPPTSCKGIFSPSFDMKVFQSAMNSDLPINIDDMADSYYKSTRDVIIEFFINIALNHSILTDESPNSPRSPHSSVTYQGTNPDEVTLVMAAQVLGIEYIGREGSVIRMKIDGHEYLYEVLHKFEFSSEAARSSIIVKEMSAAGNEIKLFIKGADDKIFKTLNSFSVRNLEEQTKEHLDKFAKSGLRTLCYAVRILKQDEYKDWDKIYSELKYQCLVDEKKKTELDAHVGMLERECILLGVSGLEDRLQDDVKESIGQLLEAGIQMWMLTGDKLDTAESIAYSSKLFDEDTEVFKIKNSNDKAQVLAAMNRILEDISSLEGQMNNMKLERKKKKKKVNVEKEKLISKEVGRNEVELVDLVVGKELKSEDPSCIPDLNGSSEIIEYKKHLSKRLSFQIQHLAKRNSIKSHKTVKFLNDEHVHKNDDEIDYDYDSQVDDVSVMKFMLDKNFFDNSMLSKKDFADTFMNNILQQAVSNASGSCISIPVKRMQSDNANIKIHDEGEVIKFEAEENQLGNQLKDEKNIMNHKDNLDNFDNGNYKYDNYINYQNSNFNEIPLNIRLNKRNNIEIEILNKRPLPIQDKEDVEEIDISNLYDYYQNRLNKMQDRKNSVRKILKFTNFDFHHARKKKTEEEEHITKDVNLFNFGLIIEGNAISLCLDDEVKATLWKLIKKSRAVICCRCNPIQKSDIVNFVKNKSGEVCLAIGDGGNDVNMLRSANVGVGIFGKEGYQAAFSSDYAISQFKYLKRLLYYHGRYALLRNSYFIYFFFYKSLIFNMPNLWFAFFSGFSGTLLWDNIYFILYTSLLTTMPPVIVMVFEEDIDITFEGHNNKEMLLNLIPDIYKEYRERSPFNSLKFFIVFFLGILHSAVIYFFPLFVFRFGNQDETGRSHTLWDQSLLGVLTVLIVQYYIIFQDTFFYSTSVIIAHSIQIAHNVVFFGMYAYLGQDQLGAFTFDIISNLKFWFTLIITLAIDLLLVIISRKVDILLSDNIINNLRNRKYEDDYTRKILVKKLQHMAKCTRSLAKFKKIYKQIDQYQADTYADRKMKDFVDMYRRNKRVAKVREQSGSVTDINTGSKKRIHQSKSLNYEREMKKTLKTLNLKIHNFQTRGSAGAIKTNSHNNLNFPSLSNPYQRAHSNYNFATQSNMPKGTDYTVNINNEIFNSIRLLKQIKKENNSDLTNSRNKMMSVVSEVNPHEAQENEAEGIIAGIKDSTVQKDIQSENVESIESIESGEKKDMKQQPNASLINSHTDKLPNFDMEKEVEVYNNLQNKVSFFPETTNQLDMDNIISFRNKEKNKK